MHAMVDNLMMLARADARQLTLTTSRVLLAAFVEECWVGLDADARAKSLAVVFQVDEDAVIETDSDKLRMIVGNLLDNAVRHSDIGGWIRVRGRRAADGAGGVELIVSNSGSALAAEDAGRAFDRFWRGESSRKDTGLHSGLGLSLCREMVALLGGRITATSDPGGVFEVRLWLAPSHRSPSPSENLDVHSSPPVAVNRVIQPPEAATQCL
jgi:signal transduction histidine kinase